MKKYIALVDVYSTGNFLPCYFREAGIGLIHVLSTARLMPTMLAPNLAEYEYQFALHGDNLQEIIDSLKEKNVIAVIAGQEPGVPLADLLSERLGLTSSNGTALSNARRNKYEMIQVLKKNNINTAQQIKSTQPSVILDWVIKNNHYPCVIKPLSSASTDGVTICHNQDDIKRACQIVLKNNDIFGKQNTEILCQSFLDGNEYIIDTVSCNGSIYVCGIWKYVKKQTSTGKIIYDRDVLIDASEPVATQLITYVKKVLPALGILHGPAHTEVIIAKNGPALVETGARLNGNMHPQFHDIVLGENQARLTYLAYCQPDHFLNKFAARTYRKRKEACVMNTSTDRTGKIKFINESAVKEIEELETVFKVSVKYQAGKTVVPTIDLLTSPLRIFLFSAQQSLIDNDYNTIEKLKEKVYVLNI